MRSMLTLFVSCSLFVPLGAQFSPGHIAKLDCARFMKAQWNSAQRGAAQADCEFYNASLEDGGDAWGDFAAPNASLPHGKGKDEIRAAYKKTYADAGFRLSWHPERAEQFGSTYVVTSGPYELHLQRDAKEQARHGTYITVWQQQPDGSWRFVWDGGEDAKEQK
jgi:hypothetical protein